MGKKKAPQGGEGSAAAEEKLGAPHNNFFAYVFGQKEHAVGLLKAILPTGLVEKLNWAALQREPVSYVDGRLRWLHSDLLFSLKALGTDQPVLVYVLVEHQRRVHQLMAFRLLRYITRIWTDYLRKNKDAEQKGKLPLVVPLVIYNGRSAWTPRRSLRENFDAPAELVKLVENYLPQLEFALVHLQEKQAAHVVEETLTTLGRVALWAMEVADDDERVISEMGRLTALLAEMTNQPDSVGALGALLRYILATHQRLDRSVLKTALSNVLKAPKGDLVVTVYEQLIEQGRIEGRATMLLDQLAAKFGPLSPAAKERVQNASNPELRAWGVRVLTASTLDDVFVATPVSRRSKKRAPLSE